MNDTELDRLLDSWQVPAPPPSVRKGLRLQFPRPERRSFARTMRWALAIAVASATLAAGVEQSGGNPWNFRIVRMFNAFYDGLIQSMEASQASSILAKVRHSAPKVYVDGQPAGPLEYGHAATMIVQVPGEGRYSITSYPYLGSEPWAEAGHFSGSAIEFQAGAKHIRIQCNRTIVDSDRPVFAMRWQ